MTTNPKAEEQSRGTENEQEANPVAVGLVQIIEEQYRKTKEHAVAYPYVWASYTLVYGTLGLWLIYRLRCLRKAEDRIRALHAQISKQYEEEASGSAEVAARSVKYGSSTPKPPSDDKVNK